MTRTSIALPLGLAACLLVPCSGCVTAPDERPPALSLPAAAPAEAPAAPDASLPPSMRRPVRLYVEQSEGAETARLRAAFAPAQAAVGECIPGSGGIVRLRLVSGPTGARFTFEPSVGLGPRERRCVLEALSTIDPVSISDEAGPAARPTGFSALFRIEW